MNFEKELIIFVGIHLLQWFSTSRQSCNPPNSPHTGHLKMSGDIFYYRNLGCYLWAEVMNMLNILQCTE